MLVGPTNAAWLNSQAQVTDQIKAKIEETMEKAGLPGEPSILCFL